MMAMLRRPARFMAVTLPRLLEAPRRLPRLALGEDRLELRRRRLRLRIEEHRAPPRRLRRERRGEERHRFLARERIERGERVLAPRPVLVEVVGLGEEERRLL